MTIDPGTLNRRATIRRYTAVASDGWNPVQQWADHRAIWVALKYDSVDEEHSAGQGYAVRVVTFTARFTTDLFEVDRLNCEGVEYEILGIREIGFRDGLEVKARAFDPDAGS